MAKTKGIRALQVEKQRRDAEEEQRRKQQVSQCSALLLILSMQLHGQKKTWAKKDHCPQLTCLVYLALQQSPECARSTLCCMMYHCCMDFSKIVVAYQNPALSDILEAA